MKIAIPESFSVIFCGQTLKKRGKCFANTKKDDNFAAF